MKMQLEDNNRIVDCIERLTKEREVKRATWFISPQLTVKATRLHKMDRRNRCESFVVTIGVPNYSERRHIKSAKKTLRNPFPFFYAQPWPKKRKAAKK